MTSSASPSLVPASEPAAAARGTAGRRVLIAVPIYNEVRHAPRVLERLRDVPHDKLFVDDGSTDGTLDLLADAERRGEVAVVRHATNAGYGASIIDAFKFAGRHGYEWVVTMDCDEQHDPDAIPAFVAELDKDDVDLVSGSRYLRPDGVRYRDEDLPPPERRAVNLIVTATLNELFGWSMTDSFCGFKAHRVGPTLSLDLDERGYAFPLQLWPRVQSAGLRVREIPVKLIYNDADRSFGHDVRAGDLDNARVRLGHYLDVLRDELCEKNLPRLSGAEAAVLDGLPAEIHAGLRETLRQSYEAAAAVECP